MFRCKVCPAKDQHVRDLQAQIEDLRRLVFPAAIQAHLSPVQVQADAMLSGNEEAPHTPSSPSYESSLTPEQAKYLASVKAEAEALLSGTY